MSSCLMNLAKFTIFSVLLQISTSAYASGELPAGKLYMCDSGNPTIQVLLPDEVGKNPILMLEGEQFEMAPMPVGSGFGADLMLGPNHWIVRGKGSDILLLSKNEEPAKFCNAKMAQKSSTGQKTGIVSAMGNFSLGGKVRSGPGLNNKKIDSLPFGEPVILLERTGVMMDGYEWFKIEYSEGLQGYQWGGIMCSNALHITGLYDPCPAEIK